MKFGRRVISIVQLFRFIPLFSRDKVVHHPRCVAAIEFQYSILHLLRVSIIPAYCTAGYQPQILNNLRLKWIRHGHRQMAVSLP